MRRIPGLLAVCVVGLGVTGPALGLDAPPAADPEKTRKVDAILAEWEHMNAPVTQLDATFKRVDLKTGAFKGKAEYEGRFLFKDPNLAAYDVRKLDPETPGRSAFHERCLWTGEEFIRFDGGTRIITIIPTKDVARRAEVEARAKVEKPKGPLAGLFDFRALEMVMASADWHPAASFLIHVKAGAFKSRYSVALMAEGARVYRLRVVPRGEVDKQVFSMAMIDLNKRTYLPDAILLHSPNGKETMSFAFSSIKPNGPIKPANFQFREVEGWKVLRHPAAAARAEPEAEPLPGAKGPEQTGAEEDPH